MRGGRGVSEAMKISWRPLRWCLGLPPQAGIRDSHLYIPLIKRPQLNYTFNYTSTKWTFLVQLGLSSMELPPQGRVLRSDTLITLQYSSKVTQ